jgi:hypothetical protein
MTKELTIGMLMGVGSKTRPTCNHLAYNDLSLGPFPLLHRLTPLRSEAMIPVGPRITGGGFEPVTFVFRPLRR